MSNVRIAPLILFGASQHRHILIRFSDGYTKPAGRIDVGRENWIVVGPNKLDVIERNKEDRDIGVGSVQALNWGPGRPRPSGGGKRSPRF